jgi:hypothetical protein
MCTKRGQVTVFLIIGVVVLLLSAGIFFITSKTVTQEIYTEAPDSFSDKGKVQIYVESCLEDMTVQGIEVLSLQGGFYKIDTGLKTENLNIAYGNYEGQLLLTKDIFGEELSKYVQDNLQYCIQNFEIFEEFTINTLSPEEVTIEMQTDGLIANLKYGLEIVQGNDKERISKFQSTVKSNAAKALEIFSTLTIDNIEPLKEPFISILSYDEFDHVISMEYKDGYFFATAMRVLPVDLPPKLSFIPDQVLKKDVPFYHETDSYDPEEYGLFIVSDTPEIPIGEDGVFDFVPQKTGTFNVKITITDLGGNTDEQTVRFIVE